MGKGKVVNKEKAKGVNPAIAWDATNPTSLHDPHPGQKGKWDFLEEPQDTERKLVEDRHVTAGHI